MKITDRQTPASEYKVKKKLKSQDPEPGEDSQVKSKKKHKKTKPVRQNDDLTSEIDQIVCKTERKEEKANKTSTKTERISCENATRAEIDRKVKNKTRETHSVPGHKSTDVCSNEREADSLHCVTDVPERAAKTKRQRLPEEEKDTNTDVSGKKKKKHKISTNEKQDVLADRARAVVWDNVEDCVRSTKGFKKGKKISLLVKDTEGQKVNKIGSDCDKNANEVREFHENDVDIPVCTQKRSIRFHEDEEAAALQRSDQDQAEQVGPGKEMSKKKKSKGLKVEPTSAGEEELLDQEEQTEAPRKIKSKALEVEPQMVKEEEEKTEAPKKKKRKCKALEVEPQMIEERLAEEEKTEAPKKKKKKCKALEVEPQMVEEKEHQVDVEQAKVPKKKNKTKKCKALEVEPQMVEEKEHQVDVEQAKVPKKKNKTKKCKALEVEPQMVEEKEHQVDVEQAKVPKKKNKTKKCKVLEVEPQMVEELLVKVEKAEAPKKMKNRKHKVLEVESQMAKMEEAGVSKKKKNKKPSVLCKVDIKIPKAKKTKLETVSDRDVQVLSVKRGNADEVEIDTNACFGQWDTASFQNSDHKAKFLRLLGGFKKGNAAPPTSSPSQEKANMALSKPGEQALERNLQEEFDKALNWKQNRGVGLGFQTTPKKSFFIDKTSSRSVKFED